MESEKKSMYAQSAMNWRESIKTNNRKTTIVLLIFFMTYSLLGLVLDVIIMPPSAVIAASSYQNNYASGGDIGYLPAGLSSSLIQILTFNRVPYITLFLQAVAVCSIGWTRFCNQKILLMGTSYKEVLANTLVNNEKQALNILDELKIASSMQYVPKLYVIDAPFMNAFASGWDEKNAIIAITRTLLDNLERDELQAVLAHELSHIRHQDIKLTLTVTVLSNIMLIILDVLLRNLLYGRSSRGGRSREAVNPFLLLIVSLLRVFIPLLNILLIMYLSRTREYLADAGAVELLRNNTGLAKALVKIQNNYTEKKSEHVNYDEGTAHESLRYQSYIYMPVRKGMMAFISRLFSTHPSIAQRLEAMGYKKIEK